MKEFIQRLSSRKFLVTVSTALGLVSAKAYGEAVAVAVAYIAAEGAADITTIRNASQAIADEVQAGNVRLQGEL